MAFRFKTLGQEIHVWHILNKTPYDYDGPNKAFVEALSTKNTVELAEGVAVLVAQSKNDAYDGDTWIVFEYRGKQWRVDIDQYSSWDEDGEVSEPYEVSAKPVNEIQYVRVK